MSFKLCVLWSTIYQPLLPTTLHCLPTICAVFFIWSFNLHFILHKTLLRFLISVTSVQAIYCLSSLSSFILTHLMFEDYSTIFAFLYIWTVYTLSSLPLYMDTPFPFFLLIQTPQFPNSQSKPNSPNSLLQIAAQHCQYVTACTTPMISP